MADMSIIELGRRFHPQSRITIVTGAGVSAASGIPTFRGAEGLWKNFKPEQLATPGAFQRDPKLVWEWYDWRRQIVASKKPNAAHEVIAAWSGRYPNFALITQNVDGLHEQAGTQNVIRFHGSIWEVSCWNRCPDSPARWEDRSMSFPEIPPHCPHCRGLIRPGVVWFGEAIDPNVLARSAQVADCDLFLTIGTSSVVYPAAGLIHEAKRHGAYTVEINVEKTPASDLLDLALTGAAEQILPQIEAVLSSL
jgi:NAD-dependent deacetylase